MKSIPTTDRASRVRIACTAIGAALLTYAGVAYAGEANLPGPGWDLIATTLAGIASLLVAAYARGLERRLGAVEVGLAGLKERVLTDYHDASETERNVSQSMRPLEVALQHLSGQVAAIHARMDSMNVPQARSSSSGSKA